MDNGGCGEDAVASPTPVKKKGEGRRSKGREVAEPMENKKKG